MTYKEYCLTNFNYEVKTTFFDDFSIADRFGAAAIKDLLTNGKTIMFISQSFVWC